MNFTSLETPRLYLRHLTPEVYHHVYKTYGETEIKEFFGFQTPEEFAKEKEKFSKGLTTYRQTFSNFQLINKSTGQIIGMCGFHSWFPEHRRAEIGYHLTVQDARTKGYMSEAIGVVLKYGFEIMNLNRIEAFIGKKNTPSLKLVEKYGFIQEGCLRSHYCNNGIIEDSLIFGLLKADFKLK